MLDKRYFKNGHITDFAILMLETCMLGNEEKQLMLTHMNSCDDCMQLYIDSLGESELIEPPVGLENRVMNLIRHETETKKNTRVIAIQFVKLAVAVCLTMVLFFGGAYSLFKIGPQQIQNDQQQIHQQQQHEKPSVKRDKGILEGIADNFNSAFFDFASKINLGIKGDNNNGTK